MDKTKSRSKGLVKGVAVGFALMLCSAFFPAHAIANAAEYKGATEINANTTRIEVGKDANQTQNINVKKGDTVQIPQGVYYYNGGKHTIGGAEDTTNNIKSSVKVYYKATNDLVVDNVASDFVADRVGRYSIVYTVNHGDNEYSYELTVNCVASEASFEFATNSENIIPSVYDIALADNKDIVLPLPTVKDNDGEEIETEYVLSSDDVSDDATSYVKLSIVNSGKDVTIKSRDNNGKTEYYISGEDLSKAELNGQEFKVYYSYYQVGSKDVFVSSVSKSFTVKSNYYYETSDKESAGYDLETSWSTSVSSLSAVVGVEKDLPKVTATTKSTNSPASESVEVYYTVKVVKDGEDVTDKVITEDGKFKANAEGDYKFIYTVKDFYGKSVKESLTTFTIENVKDSLSASVYMYDAGNGNAYDEVKNTYVSAENILKSQSTNQNIIMYAVGGTDNMVKKDELTLRREIRDNSSVKMFVVDEEAYNEYNLVFAPAAATNEELTLANVRKQVVQDNYEIRKQMLMEGKKIDNASDIETFFTENNYLIVTTEENSFNKVAIDDTKEVGATLTAAEYIAKGFAYVKPENVNNTTFKDQTYSFYYYASDNINKEKSVYYTVKVSKGLTDAEVPTLTFSNDLQATYLPTESFEFNVATANDTTDTRIKAVTAYRFLNSAKEPIEYANTQALEYVVENAKSTAWYAQTGLINKDTEGNKGWFVDESKSTYTIDLSTKTDAKYVEILAYAIDDNGNAGFYNKIIKVAEAADADIPDLYKVVNAPDASQSYKAPETITLPTLYFEDSNVNNMHASVAVYKVAVDGTKTRLQSTNMSTEYDMLTDSFKVVAGTFHASTAGDYQVAVSVSDSGNHSVTTYFNYTVGGSVVIDSPEINNISADTVELEAGQAYYLAPPTINMSETETYGFVGIDNEDDSNTATNYTTTVVSATGEYDLDQYYFTGNEKGLFKLQYKVYLLQYLKKTADVQHVATSASTATNGQLFFDANGSLKFKYDNNEYFVYIDRENTDEENTNPILAHMNKQGITSDAETAISDNGLTALKALVTAHILESKVQTINVGGVEMEVTLDDNAYADSYSELGKSVEIIKPTNITFNGSSYQTNTEASKVTITKTVGNTTTTLGEFSFAEWAGAVDTDSIRQDFTVEGSTIKLNLNDNGKYTIKYTIQAMDKSGMNVGSAKTMEYTISNGDVIAPELELSKNLVKEKYSINDTMTLNFAGISVSDLGTTDKDEILKTMVVTLENTDLDEGEITLTNEDEDGGYAYSHKLTSAGSYTLKITVTDKAGNSTTEKVSFVVSTDEKEDVDVKEVMGGVLIGLSVALLAGVVIYFVVSKVKLDKKEKSYKNGNDKK